MASRVLTFAGASLVGLMAVAALVGVLILGARALDADSPPVLDSPPATLQGCVAHPDGEFTRHCSLAVSCDDGKSTCILDDGTVCLGACDPCVRLIAGEWIDVNGWQNEQGEPVTVTPSVDGTP